MIEIRGDRSDIYDGKFSSEWRCPPHRHFRKEICYTREVIQLGEERLSRLPIRASAHIEPTSLPSTTGPAVINDIGIPSPLWARLPNCMAYRTDFHAFFDCSGFVNNNFFYGTVSSNCLPPSLIVPRSLCCTQNGSKDGERDKELAKFHVVEL